MFFCREENQEQRCKECPLELLAIELILSVLATSQKWQTTISWTDKNDSNN
jgi:hypothetical protein